MCQQAGVNLEDNISKKIIDIKGLALGSRVHATAQTITNLGQEILWTDRLAVGEKPGHKQI